MLALFLLGAWLAVTVLPRLSGARRVLWRTAWLGGTVGLLASGLYAAIKAEARPTFELSGVGLVQTVAYTLGTTPLALAYIALVALAILVTQQRVCTWWLARHAQGPVEWIWRRATYGRGREMPAS